MSKKYTGMYLGIIVQNNDPKYRGRVKVYVPHIQANVYENWFSELSDKKFRFPGGNIESDLSKILPELKTVLPWAENAMPMIGASGSGRYGAHDDIATISDSNRYETLIPDKHQTDVEKKYKLNDENIGEKPGKVYEHHKMWVSDAFTNTKNPDHDGSLQSAMKPFNDLKTGDRLNGVNRPNTYSYMYRPTTYSNCAKGSFSIPNVGSHVWVFFQGGDPLLPVVFGVSHGQEDWRGIFESTDSHGQDYPGSFENISTTEERVFDNNTETYRNKYVINQKGGSLEFVNTDNREILKMTHYSGSFLEFNNHVNIEFASKNAQRLVQEDAYDTVKGYRNQYTERDYDFIVRGDRYKRIGYQNYNVYEEWHKKARTLAEVKALFESARVNGKVWVNGSLLETKQVGVFAPCPVCNDEEYIRYHALNTVMTNVNKTDTHSSFNGAHNATLGAKHVGYVAPIGRFKSAPYGVIYKDNGTNKTMDSPPYQSASKHKGGGSGQIFGETCPVCGGTGVSPSTMEGDWEDEPLKSDSNFDSMLKSTVQSLAEIESKMGLGGSEFVNVAKHRIETIGMIMNEFPSIRIDPVGKMYRDKMVIHKNGVFASKAPTPMVEMVHVDDSPGGVNILNVGCRWNVQVGSGGVSIKTTGRVEMSGSQFNIGAEQINVASDNEVNIDGGKRLSLVGDIVSIRQRKRGQILVDSDLGVSQNVIIGGGLHVEGELSCNHLTIPVEIHETECAKIYSKLLKNLRFTCNINGGTHVVSPHGGNHPSWSNATVTLIADSNDNHVVDYSHSHLFKNGAMHLMASNADVREAAKTCNEDTEDPFRAPAMEREVMTSEEKVKGKEFVSRTEKADSSP